MRRKTETKKTDKEYIRTIHTDNYAEVLNTFTITINRLLNAGGHCNSPRKLSQLIGINLKTIHAWTAGTRLPRTEVLPLIANVFGVSTDYLLGNTTLRPTTYSTAFLSIEALDGLVEIEMIKDPFLKYMTDEYQSLQKQNYLPKRELDAWKEKLLDDYNVPLLPASLTCRIKPALSIYSTISRYATYYSCLSGMQRYQQNKDSIDEPFEVWAIKDSGREKELLDTDGRPTDIELYPSEWLEPALVPEDVDETEPDSDDTVPMEFVPLTDEEHVERKNLKPDNAPGLFPQNDH